MIKRNADKEKLRFIIKGRGLQNWKRAAKILVNQ